MAFYDVFNGDADGICALTQLRNAEPRAATLVTGVKRDINLLERVDAQAGDEITVLDVSMDKNREGLQRALGVGARVFYCDHHHAGEIPEVGNLTHAINTAPDVCTSSLINGHLKGAFLGWAVVGTFGDNLKDSAQRLAKPLNLTPEELARLEKLGICINYNGYGSALEDLHFHPKDLYLAVSPHATPQAFMAEDKEAFSKLEQGYDEDMANASNTKAHVATDKAAVYLLPDAAWARRVSGVYSNDLANEHPDRGHAVVTVKPDGDLLVSVRAPLNNKTGADEFCRGFDTGGGRAAAAGINALPESEFDQFCQRFTEFYS